ncbi:peptide deformylase [Blochmannia endosymbiont of Camponotus sp. C-003]|uniref:peptide deformylase n=1 Tax=unclassified Candidatus Blochmanniella TaxID=711328 RepID=UPI002023C713|nr:MULTISPECIES: peptide deformylase [unclassified Candidatus Blochmannia]URJ23585.1 peptide deformylase [Blochmannia endosymbiont of Camponotus sp. C-003]URJ28501.1 peptide deformylase [Blochmannia endosymbiont of Camponotus sp. C-046]
MSILEILYYPDERLRTIADPVVTVSNDTNQIISDMFDTMYFKKGIGLAATQVNIHQQIIVVDLYKKDNQRLVFINPVITKKEGIISITESCLSIPQIYEIIPRSAKITIQSLDQCGNKFEMEADKLLAICIQHEVDHLFGKLFIDYLSPLQIKRIHKKIKKLSKTFKKNQLSFDI